MALNMRRNRPSTPPRAAVSTNAGRQTWGRPLPKQTRDFSTATPTRSACRSIAAPEALGYGECPGLWQIESAQLQGHLRRTGAWLEEKPVVTVCWRNEVAVAAGVGAGREIGHLLTRPFASDIVTMKLVGHRR